MQWKRRRPVWVVREEARRAARFSEAAVREAPSSPAEPEQVWQQLLLVQQQCAGQKRLVQRQRTGGSQAPPPGACIGVTLVDEPLFTREYSGCNSRSPQDEGVRRQHSGTASRACGHHFRRCKARRESWKKRGAAGEQASLPMLRRALGKSDGSAGETRRTVLLIAGQAESGWVRPARCQKLQTPCELALNTTDVAKRCLRRPSV